MDGVRLSHHKITKPPTHADEAGSKCNEGAGHIFPLPTNLNRYPIPSGAYYPTRPLSNWIRFEDLTLLTSEEAAVAGLGLGH